jgi:hypothetical protein
MSIFAAVWLEFPNVAGKIILIFDCGKKNEAGG